MRIASHWRRGVCLMALAFVLSGCGGDEGPERREVASANNVHMAA